MPTKSNTTTFYCHDRHNHKFLRLAIVESVGLTFHVGKVLQSLYPETLYIREGAAPKELTDNIDVRGTMKKVSV